MLEKKNYFFLKLSSCSAFACLFKVLLLSMSLRTAIWLNDCNSSHVNFPKLKFIGILFKAYKQSTFKYSSSGSGSIKEIHDRIGPTTTILVTLLNNMSKAVVLPRYITLLMVEEFPSSADLPFWKTSRYCYFLY